MSSPVRNPTRTPSRDTQRHSISTVSAERRHWMIARAAYYFSQQRGFAPGHELDDWLAAESKIDAALGRNEAPTVAGSSNVPANTAEVAQEQTKTESHDREQKPWYPRIESMLPVYNVENWQNRSVDDHPVSLEDIETEEDKIDGE